MRYRAALLILALGLLASVPGLSGRRALGDDEDRERAAMGRFLGVLERDPRRGTALDRVYGFHVERGELDPLILKYRDRAANDPNNGAAWLLLGLLESQRGRDGAAVSAFRSAEAARPDDPLPAYYLGQSLVLVGQPDRAAEAFERALSRKPTRNDLLEIYQALGRVHQRARRDDRALAVWNRLEAIFPDDPRVQEQIASALAEDGRLEPALARFEKLAGSSRDPYRRLRFRLEAADLKVKLGKPANALRDYESLLAGLDPESWIFREVRRKTEDVFRRDDDLAGLANYYERMLARSPDDLDAMTRLGRVLASQGRTAEAQAWLDRALKLAPSNQGIRIALVEQLVKDRKFAEAATQYEALANLGPTNPDTVRDWGRMLLRDPSKPEAARKAAAAAVWRKLVDARADDPSTLVMVAEWFRQAGMVDEALTLNRQAIALAPGSPQYREYLGESLHQLKRPAEALATWRGIAEGPARTSENLSRLGEILAKYGYKAEAIEAAADAIRLGPDSYPLRVRLATWLREARRFDEAEAQLIAAEPLAEGEEHREELVGQRIAVDEVSGRLITRVEALKAETAGPKAGDALTWRRLARYAEAASRPAEATSAAEKAVGLDGTSIAARVTLARLYEATGRLGEAAEATRALATIDRRSRSEHLTSVARLEARLGRKDEALKAGREVLATAPGNPEALQFFADLCFQLGEADEALDTLRRAVRANETDVSALTRLAEALTREFRTEEAIEVSWKAFERSTDLDVRLALVSRLAELHLRRNQFDRLTARLERLQGEDGKRREGAFLLARAAATLGDFGAARRHLEGLLEANGRDTALLQQLSRLAEDEGDALAALKFHQQLHEMAPDRESEKRLVQLALKAGEVEVAEAIWSKTLDGDSDQASVLLALGSLSQAGKFDAVLATTNRRLRSDPDNWELLYREARTLMALGRPDEASDRYRAILRLRRDDDEPSAAAKAMRKANGQATVPTRPSAMIGVYYRSSQSLRTARYVAGLATGFPLNQINAWSPGDFGMARIAALAAELARARKAGTEAEWLAKGPKPTDPRSAWDALYVAQLYDDSRRIYEAARDLVRVAGHSTNTDFVLLNSLANRTAPPGVAPRATRPLEDTGPDRTPPLPPDEVDLVRDAFRLLLRNATAYLRVGTSLDSANAELRRAGRLGEIEADYRVMVDSINDDDSFFVAGLLASDRGDIEALRKVSDAFNRLPAGNRSPIPSLSYFVTTPQGNLAIPAFYMARGMRAMADSKRYGDILRLVDDELAAIESPPRVAQRARAGQPLATATPSRNAYPVFTTSRAGTASQTLDYPTPTSHLEAGSILLLRGAFTFFKRDDRAGELVAHLRTLATDPASAKDPAAERNIRLALSAVLWWNEERNPAVSELARASALSPGDLDLQLLTAEMYVTRREPEKALAIVDAIEASDQDATRRRELLALRLAVQTNRADRARQAAERLFGLRLDQPTQLQLATVMHQLGMHDLAEAVLARARRQVGNNTSGLLELMAHYRLQGNLDAASEIAVDILRRSTGQALRAGVVEDPNRRQALEVLTASGKLPELITRLENQVRTMPDSLPIRQSLAAYYKAAGQLDQLKTTNEAILRLRPEDTALRMQVATQLAQSGDLDAALGHYRAVFRQDPTLLSTYSAAIFATFQQANREEELVRLIDEVGLKNFDNTTSIANLVLRLMADPKTIDQGSALLRKALEAYPTTRSSLLNAVAPIGPFWDRPEAYELAKSGLIPAQGTLLADPWTGPGDPVQAGGWTDDGKLNTLTTRLLDASDRLGQLDDLAGAIQSSLARRGDWVGGRALLAAVRIRQGRVDEGRLALETILADPDARPPFEALMVLGEAVKGVPACGPLAIALYEQASKSPAARNIIGFYLRASTLGNLALLHHQAGRSTEARALVREGEETARKASSASTVGSAALSSYRLVNALANSGSLYLDVGDHVDALRVFDEFLGSPDEVQSARGFAARDVYASVDSLVATAREGLGRALNGLTRESLPLTLETLIKPGDPSKPVDFRAVVYPREVDRAEVRSLLVNALILAASDPATLAEVKANLEAIAQAKPSDFEAQTALALVAPPGSLAPLAVALGRLADEAPLPPIRSGARPDAKLRDEAARRLGLWLVARRCWEQESTAELGDRLAAKGFEAARTLADPAWALAMLRELGRRALDRGDRAGAEARFAAMLGLIQQDALAPSPAPAPFTTKSRPRVRAFTVRRFRQSAEFAALAGESGLAGLSLRAIRDALKGGPPVVPVGLTRDPALAGRPTAPGSTVETPPDAAIVLVEAKLVELVAVWDKAKVAPEAIYETLRDAVLPPDRPTEIFAYDPEASRAGSRPGAVLKLLARRARLVGKLDDLGKKGDERKNSPTAREAAGRLLAAIAEATAGD